MMRELKSYIYRIYLNKIQKEKFESLYQKNLFLFNRLIDEKNKRISYSCISPGKLFNNSILYFNWKNQKKYKIETIN